MSVVVEDLLNRGTVADLERVAGVLQVTKDRDDARARAKSLEARIAEGYLPTIERLQKQTAEVALAVGIAGCTCRDCEQASALLKKHAGPQLARVGRNDVTFNDDPNRVTIMGVTFVAPSGAPPCAACGAPRGEPCTDSCEDERTPDAEVVHWAAGASREARESLRHEGKPVSLLPEPKPPERPDNSMVHLDVDLLADDA